MRNGVGVRLKLKLKAELIEVQLYTVTRNTLLTLSNIIRKGDSFKFMIAYNSQGSKQHPREGNHLNVTTTFEAKGQTHAQHFHFLTTKRC